MKRKIYADHQPVVIMVLAEVKDGDAIGFVDREGAKGYIARVNIADYVSVSADDIGTFYGSLSHTSTQIAARHRLDMGADLFHFSSTRELFKWLAE